MTVACNVSSNKLSLQEAQVLVNAVEREPLELGSTWYLIPHKWWIHLVCPKDCVGHDGKIDLPRINCELLMQKTENGYELKPKLVESLDFHLITEQAFSILKQAYGVELEERDIIRRTVIQGNLFSKDVFIEIYLVELNFTYLKANQSKILKISQAETFESICAKAVEELSIPAEERNSVRFYTRENKTYTEILPDRIDFSTINNIVLANLTVYVDSGERSSCLDDSNNTGMTTRRTAGTLRDMFAAKSRGLCGLQNLGNTCFMNSALQCLSNVPELTQYFLDNAYLRELNEQNVLGTRGRLAKAYGGLMAEMWAENASYVKPTKLKSVIGEIAPRFNGYNQQDSQELTSFLLDGLHEDLNRILNKPYIEEKEDETISDDERALQAWNDYKKRNDSIIVDLFHGQLKSTVVCPVCDKVSVKFDPFCFLSVPVPAKERHTISIITLIRKEKWAKFAITHSSKAIVAQAVAIIKENLQLPESTRIVFLTGYMYELLSDDAVLSSPYATIGSTKNFYAHIVEEGPLAIVENKAIAYDRLFGPALVINFPGEGKIITRQMVYDHILPIVRDRLWKKQSSDMEVTDEENISPDKKSTEENLMPAEVMLYCDKKFVPLPTDVNEIVEIPEDNAGDFRFILRWKSSENFQNVDTSRLVERELNMTSPIKKCYSLDECLDLFTSEEQLGENDSWYCPRCKKHQKAFKKLDLWKLPKILIVHLKRFQYSRYNREKIETEVVIPTKNVDLSKKLVNQSDKSLTYDLIAISNHMGGLSSGHYTALALNGDVWVEFNDAYVSATRNTKANMPDTITLREAYILFYRRQDHCDSPAKNIPFNKSNTRLSVSPAKSPKKSASSSTPITRLSVMRQTGATPNSAANEYGENSAAAGDTPSKRRSSESVKMDVDMSEI